MTAARTVIDPDHPAGDRWADCLPVSLRAASCDLGDAVVPLTHAELRKAYDRDPSFPRPVAMRGDTPLWADLDLCWWHEDHYRPAAAAQAARRTVSLALVTAAVVALATGVALYTLWRHT